jgi:biopolymer transport protein TolR
MSIQLSRSPMRGRAQMAEINVTPLVDVMLVLLVIFMVSAPMLDLNQGVKVALPATKPAEPMTTEARDPIVITVDQKGALYLLRDEKPHELREVVSFVQTARQNDPKKDVFLRGDERVDYGKVVNLMSELQGAGVTGVGLVTMATSSSPAAPAAGKGEKRR